MLAGNFNNVSSLILASASLSIPETRQYEQDPMPTSLLDAWWGDLSFPVPVSSQNLVLSGPLSSGAGAERDCYTTLNTGPSLVFGTGYTDFNLPLNLGSDVSFQPPNLGASLSCEPPLSTINQRHATTSGLSQALMPTGLSLVTPGIETNLWGSLQTLASPQVGHSVPHDMQPGGILMTDLALGIRQHQPEHPGWPEPVDGLACSLEQRLASNRHPQSRAKIPPNKSQDPKPSHSNRCQSIISRKRVRTALPRYARAETAETRELAACIRCQRVKKRVSTQWPK